MYYYSINFELLYGMYCTSRLVEQVSIVVTKSTHAIHTPQYRSNGDGLAFALSQLGDGERGNRSLLALGNSAK
eukprot:COSAG02_NODE_67_length_42609_cov_14.506681_35_plen_73_part_00